jgi:hypothetical protein
MLHLIRQITLAIRNSAAILILKLLSYRAIASPCSRLCDRRRTADTGELAISPGLELTRAIARMTVGSGIYSAFLRIADYGKWFLLFCWASCTISLVDMHGIPTKLP